jgi:hypothetical protein
MEVEQVLSLGVVIIRRYFSCPFFCVRVDLREREEWVNNWKRSTRIKEIAIESKWRERMISERDKNQNSLRFRWQREVRHRIETRDESKRTQRKTDGNNEREKQGRASKIRAVSYRGSHLKRGRVPTATGAAPCLHVIDHRRTTLFLSAGCVSRRRSMCAYTTFLSNRCRNDLHSAKYRSQMST